jgi:hypothetical protein
MRDCRDMRIRLEEHDKAQEKDIEEARGERMELYEHKNKIYKKITVLEMEKKFFPWAVMILSAIASLGTLIYVIVKLAGGG